MERVVRVPDLNWPTNLFIDALMPCPETITVAKRSLWKEIVDFWVGDGILPERRWGAGSWTGSDRVVSGSTS
jgi:hypothetical protein